MSAKDAHLYSVPHAKKKQSGRELSSSGSLAFSSQLSSLISSGKAQNKRPSTGRSHKQKEDIFATHNRNAHKRAKKDLDTDNASLQQKHTTGREGLDSATWHRSKRKMEEKARLYAAMKRGDVEDDEGRHMVDFDRKWAETEDGGDRRWDNESSDGSEAEDQEQVEWTDEFGRTRTGTRSQMLSAQRGQKMAAELDTRARPAAPTQILYGDTVQSAAFNPESTIAERMVELAAKRDKSLTPPPDTHFDSSKEARRKGVGFMQLSLDAEERKKQMEGLERDRQETEGKRGERERKRKEREEMMDKRRREIDVKRSRREADKFLEELEKDMAARAPGGIDQGHQAEGAGAE